MDYFAILAPHRGDVHGRARDHVQRCLAPRSADFIWSYVALGVLLQALWSRVLGRAGLILYLGLGWVGLFSILTGRQLGFVVVRPSGTRA